jgi:hypothetical protein
LNPPNTCVALAALKSETAGTGMAPMMEAMVKDLVKELAQLMTSGENWQIVLHGGRGCDGVMEVKCTLQLAPSRKQQGHPPPVRLNDLLHHKC